MPVKSGSRPLSRNLASVLLLFLNILGLILIWELLSVDEMIRYNEGGITSCEFRAQALILLAIAAANLAVSLITLLACYYRLPPRC